MWKDTKSKVDILVAGIGTDGTLSGAGRFLKQQYPKIKCNGGRAATTTFLQWDKGNCYIFQTKTPLFFT